jgi:hypothetical protein
MKHVIPATPDAFDERIEILRSKQVPQIEVDAAVTIYERLRTAQSICQALIPGAYSEPAVLALLAAISDEVAMRTPVDD